VKLWAISDLHLAAEANREGLRDLTPRPDDWLIIAGDVCEGAGLFGDTLAWLNSRFRRLIWTPGNHELWLTDPGAHTSPEKYARLVETARRFDVLTPEDPFVAWPPTGDLIVPLCTLYDYSFRPADITRANVVAWAAEHRNVAADERLINPEPFATMDEWCAWRCDQTEGRLAAELAADRGTILISHFPLREDLIRIPRIPRFTPWCGTRRTENWHIRYRAIAAVSGHLHVRRTDWRDGTRFEEVSLGYPRQWDQSKGIDAYLRLIMPDA
jgi:hypothetical protein